jgi:hypothetical protein
MALDSLTELATSCGKFMRQWTCLKALKRRLLLICAVVPVLFHKCCSSVRLHLPLGKSTAVIISPIKLDVLYLKPTRQVRLISLYIIIYSYIE